ncbi:MAG: Appr-1-p processing protein, partial [Thermoanaerobaculia bacterium]
PKVGAYLRSEASRYLPALENVSERIDGFESPLGMELLATVDWLLAREGRTAEIGDVKAGLAEWPGGRDAGARKLRLFDDRLLGVAIGRLTRGAAVSA